MTYWLSRNEQGLVIGEGDVELIQFLTDDEKLAHRVKTLLDWHLAENERKRLSKEKAWAEENYTKR